MRSAYCPAGAKMAGSGLAVRGSCGARVSSHHGLALGWLYANFSSNTVHQLRKLASLVQRGDMSLHVTYEIMQEWLIRMFFEPRVPEHMAYLQHT